MKDTIRFGTVVLSYPKRGDDIPLEILGPRYWGTREHDSERTIPLTSPYRSEVVSLARCTAACGALAWWILQTGCGSAAGATCPTPSTCPTDHRCEAAGPCDMAARLRDLRSARTAIFDPVDWGEVTARHRSSSDLDHFALGGGSGSVVYLAFEIVTEGRDVLDAVLTLHPHPGTHPTAREEFLRVRSTERFVGASLPSSAPPFARSSNDRPRPFGKVLFGRTVRVASDQPIRANIRTAVLRGVDPHRVYLSVHMPHRRHLDPWFLASPRATDRNARPRLTLLLR